MTQTITPALAQAGNLVSAGSRYQKSRVVYYGDQRKMTFETYVRVKYVQKGNEAITVINKGMEYRPDLLSFNHYGHVENWWKIMEANNLKDIWDFKAGKTIILPDESELM